MNIEEQLLAENIRKTINEACKARTDLFHLEEGNTQYNVGEGEHAERLDEASEMLAFYLEKAFRDTALLAERLGVPRYADRVIASRQTFTELSELVPTKHDVIHESKPLQAVLELFDSLATMTHGRAISGLGIFEEIIGNSAKIISYFNEEPKNEAQVRSRIFQVMSFSFRDVVREIPIAKITKTYKPDIGVPSLMAAAEYKFIDSVQEAKSALDGIYTDMKGYSGDIAWRSFYAVLYMTDAFLTQKDVDAEFRLVNADLSWTPIVIVGKGGRKSP